MKKPSRVTKNSTALVLLSLFLVSLPAAPSEAAQDSANLDLLLPAAEKLLASILPMGPQNEADVIGTLIGLCDAKAVNPSNSQSNAKPSYCSLPKLVEKLKTQTAEIYGSPNTIFIVRAETQPWLMPELLAGNYMTSPTPDGLKTADDSENIIANYFVLRSRVASELIKLQSLRIPGRTRDVRQIVLIPSLMAYLQSGNAAAAMLRVHDLIRCDVGEVLCERLKARMGAALGTCLQKQLGDIQSFPGRIE